MYESDQVCDFCGDENVERTAASFARSRPVMICRLCAAKAVDLLSSSATPPEQTPTDRAMVADFYGNR